MNDWLPYLYLRACLSIIINALNTAPAAITGIVVAAAILLITNKEGRQ